MDNAADNGKCLELLQRSFASIDPLSDRIRCICHVINLVVRALLFGEDVSEWEKRLIDASEEQRAALWSLRGIIGKLHNLVSYINRNDARREVLRVRMRATKTSDGKLFIGVLLSGGLDSSLVASIAARHTAKRVESGELLRRFAFHKHHLEAKYGAVDEQLVFHGTKPHVVDGIVAQGFDMRLNGANGTAYGKGNYFARDSSYSAGGTYSPADCAGVKCMFVARILVGETVRGHGRMRRAERPDGTLVDTAVDDEADPAIYVTFDNGQAMPVYVIGFR